MPKVPDYKLIAALKEYAMFKYGCRRVTISPRTDCLSEAKMETKHLNPSVEWAQHPTHVLITINVGDCDNPQIKVEKDKLIFKGKGGVDNKDYALEMKFLNTIDPEKSKYAVRPRGIDFALEKMEKGLYWDRLLETNVKQHWLKLDFSKWKEEDDSDDGGEDLEKMMRNMGGLGEMGGGKDSALKGNLPADMVLPWHMKAKLEGKESEEESSDFFRGKYSVPCVGSIGDDRPIVEVEINGIKTTMLFANSPSNCIPEDQLKHILPTYLANVKPSQNKIYWNIVGENIGEVDLDLKVGRERIMAPFCVVRNACVQIPLANTSGHLLIGGNGLQSELDIAFSRKRAMWIRGRESDMLLPEAEVRDAAIARGWNEIAVGEKEKSYGVLRFSRDGEKWLINIFCSTGAVQTTMDHPTRGRNQLDRSLKTMDELLNILDDPRKHTSRGYRRRKNKPNN